MYPHYIPLSHCVHTVSLYPHRLTVCTLSHCIHTVSLCPHCVTISTLYHCVHTVSLCARTAQGVTAQYRERRGVHRGVSSRRIATANAASRRTLNALAQMLPQTINAYEVAGNQMQMVRYYCYYYWFISILFIYCHFLAFLCIFVCA